MKTLQDYYQDRQSELERQLKEAKTTKQVVDILQYELKGLADIDGPYIKNLTVPEVRIAQPMLSTLIQAFNVLTTLQLQIIKSQATPQESRENKATELTEALTAALTAAIGTVLSGGALLGAGVGATAGTIAGVLVPQLKEKFLGRVKASISSEPFETTINIDTETLLRHLTEALEVIDTAVSRYHVDLATEEEQKKPKLENHPEILEFLQNFMGDALDNDVQLPPELQLRTKEVPTILRHYGIQVEFYQSSIVDAHSMFNFEPSLDPDLKDYVALKPAFVKNGQVLLRGQVIEPASSTQK